MKTRIITSVSVGLLLATVPFIYHWLGGGVFVRGTELQSLAFIGTLLGFGGAIMCATCPVWGEA